MSDATTAALPTDIRAISALGSWTCCATPAGAITDAAALRVAAVDWMAAAVPGTVASALRDIGRWDMQHPPAIDEQDWWYRTTFKSPEHAGQLCFDGLATLAEVWLNGQHILSTDNMFRQYRVDAAALLQAENELILCFRSLTEDLKLRRPRPRWKTNLVNQQQLRWRRTTLLGRIPGWTPPVTAIGPWRDIYWTTGPAVLTDLRLVSALESTQGVVYFSTRVQTRLPITQARLVVGSHEAITELSPINDGYHVRCTLSIADVALWWPHTHGAPALYQCQLNILNTGTEQTTYSFKLDKIAFKNIDLANKDKFSLMVNGAPVYCRGACWSTSDMFTLDATEDSLRHDLQLARDAGINMLRVGGTMAYESNRFYQLCDELGILVWQDFMFANMDYPVDDPAFLSNIETEARQQLQRLAPHACVAIYCGNSEIEQQAAMLGMPRELWRNAWFGVRLPELCAELHAGAPYVPSTPSGGVLPFHTRTGLAHYYGIGAYLRTPAELRAADVKFTPECLGFSNIPEAGALDDIMGGLLPVTHHPRWKQRVPRDTGAGWDFEDVRDFYLHYLYDLDPVDLRSFNMPRYLQLSRVAGAEMMAKTFSEWRSTHSQNSGGLVWFYKDLWPAAGWGIVDNRGNPKAPYYFLRRVWQNRQVLITDEGLDGLHLHLINETDAAIEVILEVVLLKEPQTILTSRELPCTLAARSCVARSIDEIIGSFFDVNYAYRFGPPHHDMVMVTLYDNNRRVISTAYHGVHRREPAMLSAAHIETKVAKVANATNAADNAYDVTVHSDQFLHHVSLTARGYLPDDNYFHLPPSRHKTIRFSPRCELKPETKPKGTFKATLEALNVADSRTVTFK